jgi:hypothetical protein
MQGLTQVVAGRGQEEGLGTIGLFGRLLRLLGLRAGRLGLLGLLTQAPHQVLVVHPQGQGPLHGRPRLAGIQGHRHQVEHPADRQRGHHRVLQAQQSHHQRQHATEPEPLRQAPDRRKHQ